MPRSLYQNTIMVKGPAGAIPLAGAAVTFRDPQDGLPIAYPLYADGVSLTPLTLPYVTGVLGELEVWADLPHRVRIDVVKGGLTQAQETIDLEYPPEYSATTEDITNAIEAHEAKENPHPQYATDADLTAHFVDPNAHDQYLTEQEGDDRYLGIGYSPDLTNYYTKGEADTAFLDQGEGDLRYEQLSKKGAASGYVPLGADTKIPNAYLPDLAITNTFVVTSEAEMLALTAQTGDVCVRLDTTENYILAAEPATVLANWTKLAASTTAGNTTIVKREEFAPAAASTSVALQAVPTQMLSVSRNGVEQSQPAGHYTVAGVTVTFTDAFVAGERVSVVYEVGSSAPAPINGYTKVESDARYEPIDTMYTKAESDAKYLTQALGDARYVQISAAFTQAQADLRYLQLSTNQTRLNRLTINGELAMGSSSMYWGDVSAYSDATTILNFDGTIRPMATNARDLGALSLRWRSGYFGTVVSIAGASATANQITHAITTDAQPRLIVDGNGKMRWGPGASTAQDTSLERTSAGALRIDTDLGLGATVTPNGDPTYRPIIQFPAGAVIRGATTFPQISIVTNSFVDSASVNKAVNSGAAAYFQVTQLGDIRMATAPNVAAGATQTFTNHFVLDTPGKTTLTPDAGTDGLQVNGAIRIMGNNNTGLQISSRDSGAVGWLIHGQGGNLYFYDLVNVRNVLTINNNGSMNYAGGPGFYLDGEVSPSSDSTKWLGYTDGRKWYALAAALGTIQTSHASVKSNIAPLDPAACAAAVSETDWVSFSYAPPAYAPPPEPQGEELNNSSETRDARVNEATALHLKTVAESEFARHQKGYVLASSLQKTSSLFGLSDGKSTSVASDLAVVACALQSVLARLAVVEGKLA